MSLQIQTAAIDARATTRLWQIAAAAGFAILAVIMAVVQVNAVSSPVAYTNVALTQQEIDTNWAPDRTTPSGGFSSVTFGGRSNVLQMGINKDNASTLGAPNTFYLTEGLQRQIPLSDSVKADLYVDSDWTTNNKTVRAGLWGVGKDNSNVIQSYPIVEFTTEGFTGWRKWDVDHWVNLPGVPYQTNSWNTLELTHDSDTNTYAVKINGAVVSSITDETSTKLGAVILNSRNYGSSAASYTVHWSKLAYGNVLTSPQSKDDCKGTSWQTFGFKNQGLCLQQVNTGKDSRL